MSGRRRNLEGSEPWQRPDGLWRVLVTNPRTKKRTALYGSTPADVQEKRVRFLNDHVYDGQPVADRRVTVAGFLREWLEGEAKARIRASTYKGYRVCVERHLIPHIGTIRVADLAPRDIQRALTEMQKAGLSPRTAQYARSVLRAALADAVRWDELPRNVADQVRSPKVVREPIVPLTTAQVEKFLGGIEGDRFEALYVLAFCMGLRQGELLGLRWEDVDLGESSTLRVSQARLRSGRVNGPKSQLFGAPKSKQSRRSLTMPAMVVKALWRRAQIQKDERRLAGADWREFGLVFTTENGTPLDSNNLSKYFKRHLTRLGLQTVRFHDCRHTAASLLLSQGVPLRMISDILGHSQISLTADTYAHILPALKQEAADAMDDLFSQPAATGSDSFTASVSPETGTKIRPPLRLIRV